MKFDYYKAKAPASSKTLIFIGGDGDTKEDFSKIAQAVSEAMPSLNICTVTFEQPENFREVLTLSVTSISELLQRLIDEKQNTEFLIFCTSSGAYCTCLAISTGNYANNISKVIFCDPANYYLPGENDDHNGTWDGCTKYNPIGKTSSDLLKEINSNVVANVVYFTIRTCTNHQYVYSKYFDRGKDMPSALPRLCENMVKTFYKNLPAKNKGKYVELGKVPHGFIQYGNILANQNIIVDLIIDLLN